MKNSKLNIIELLHLTRFDKELQAVLRADIARLKSTIKNGLDGSNNNNLINKRIIA
jgi:hypothetical protein